MATIPTHIRGHPLDSFPPRECAGKVIEYLRNQTEFLESRRYQEIAGNPYNREVIASLPLGIPTSTYVLSRLLEIDVVRLQAIEEGAQNHRIDSEMAERLSEIFGFSSRDAQAFERLAANTRGGRVLKIDRPGEEDTNIPPSETLLGFIDAKPDVKYSTLTEALASAGFNTKPSVLSGFVNGRFTPTEGILEALVDILHDHYGLADEQVAMIGEELEALRLVSAADYLNLFIKRMRITGSQQNNLVAVWARCCGVDTSIFRGWIAENPVPIPDSKIGIIAEILGNPDVLSTMPGLGSENMESASDRKRISDAAIRSLRKAEITEEEIKAFKVVAVKEAYDLSDEETRRYEEVLEDAVAVPGYISQIDQLKSQEDWSVIVRYLINNAGFSENEITRLGAEEEHVSGKVIQKLAKELTKRIVSDSEEALASRVRSTLRDIRERRSWSWEDLAQHLRVPELDIIDVDAGRPVSITALYSIISAFTPDAAAAERYKHVAPLRPGEAVDLKIAAIRHNLAIYDKKEQATREKRALARAAIDSRDIKAAKKAGINRETAYVPVTISGTNVKTEIVDPTEERQRILQFRNRVQDAFRPELGGTKMNVRSFWERVRMRYRSTQDSRATIINDIYDRLGIAKASLETEQDIVAAAWFMDNRGMPTVTTPVPRRGVQVTDDDAEQQKRLLLKTYRQRAGLTQQGLANAVKALNDNISISEEMVSRWELGQASIETYMAGYLVGAFKPHISDAEALEFIVLVSPDITTQLIAKGGDADAKWLKEKISSDHWEHISFPALAPEWLKLEEETKQAGLLLRAYRERAGVQQNNFTDAFNALRAQLADKYGSSHERLQISSGLISLYESGTVPIDDEKLGHIIGALNVSAIEAKRLILLARPDILANDVAEEWLDRKLLESDWEGISFPALDEDWLTHQSNREGLFLRSLRERAGLLGREIAEVCSVSEAEINICEAGKTTIEYSKIGLLVAALKPSISDDEAYQLILFQKPDFLEHYGVSEEWLRTKIAQKEWDQISHPAFDPEWLKLQDNQKGKLLCAYREKKGFSLKGLVSKCKEFHEQANISSSSINRCELNQASFETNVLGYLAAAFGLAGREAKDFILQMNPEILANDVPQEWLDNKLEQGNENWEHISFPALDNNWLEKQDVHEQAGKRLRAYRERLGLSQTELAKRIGVQRPTLTRWEQGNDYMPLPDPGNRRSFTLFQNLIHELGIDDDATERRYFTRRIEDSNRSIRERGGSTTTVFRKAQTSALSVRKQEAGKSDLEQQDDLGHHGP